MARSQRVRTTALTLANLLLPIAVLVFAAGFFPYKPVLPGLATSEEQDGNERAGGRDAPVFDKVIFMVVDALRSDFVYGYESGMQFTQSLIRSGAAIPFTAHATPPTVTMPRVKALTTGSVPSFLDLILNFAESDTSSSLAAQDTWLAQIRAQGGSVVFYGDDTWLKLFPPNASTGTSFFAREDGTSSFFVSDFTEVDHNVTRHVAPELARPDWNAMVMHYLGLDHIGHKTGPQGPNMLPKQREMDGIVRRIYEAMENEEHHKDTLLVLCGDHGMNAGGNHGGSGPGETEPALLFASPKIRAVREKKTYECPTSPKEGTEFHYYTKVEQSDLVPTLAGLMGFPISRNSLGVFIPEMNDVLGEDEGAVRGHLERNARQIMKIVEKTYGGEGFERRVEIFKKENHATGEMCEEKAEGEARLACLWAYAGNVLESRSSDTAKQATLMAFLLEAQETLSGTASSYNIPLMVGGMALTTFIVILSLHSFPRFWPPSTAGISLALTTLLYGIMMFASSYVEEEQQFWYWVTPAWILLFTVQTASQTPSPRTKYILAMSATAILAVHRFCVRWNQTGQKHAGEPDIVHGFFPEAHVLMWLLILATYACNGYFLVQKAFAGLLAPEIGVLLAVALELPAVVFKLNFTQADAPELVQGLAEQIRELTSSFDLVLQARVVFAGLATVTIVVMTLAVLSARESTRLGMKEAGLLPSLAERLHVLLTLFLITQSRAPNVPLFLGLEVQKEALIRILNVHGGKERRVTAVALTTLLLSHVYFFCTGGSNSISSIDLSNAYNGVADYNIVAVGVLLFASNWTGPIWWCSAASGLLTANPSIPSQALQNGRSWIDNERSKLHSETLQAMMGPEKSREAQSQADERSGGWSLYISCMTAFISAGLLAVMAACTALRTHLFIWTVFSPKYLYAMAWAVGWHLLFNIGFGSLMGWVAGVA
ncbi:hypothetical protein M409DRAFT_62460 [Zasmidium cellare ATCC 36951]|uniref:GPI ethanolamine phosphate transferase 2 n=1 Tax=Zasmidium cellare ATCC 36951 TaxID=1080233 RepID=A0A6A6D019_ZASCE|nr:uncharacterized protein M409DRAFT_62460 [Zasmidium cellare ATCC 36951]KAF2172754.1 hypothetical protein M409DRAFT_62460 [Zasmidium cellare ATCC 36951]